MDRRYVGIDLHRPRSVIYAMDAEGEKLFCERIDNDALRLLEQPNAFLRVAQFGVVRCGRARLHAVLDISGLQPVVQTRLGDPEVSRDVLDSNTWLTALGNTDHVLTELTG